MKKKTNKKLVKKNNQQLITAEQIALIKSVVAKDLTNDELKLFFYECRRRNVHPLDRLIYPVKRAGRLTFQVSIDYLRARAESSGQYAGQDAPVFIEENNKLVSATITVYRKGIERGFSATAFWSEYYPGEQLGFMWQKMPHTMLAKCAEALALRKAFPEKLAGLYAEEELEQAIKDDEKMITESNKKTKIVIEATGEVKKDTEIL